MTSGRASTTIEHWAGITCSATMSKSCGSGSAIPTCSGRRQSRRWLDGSRRRGEAIGWEADMKRRRFIGMAAALAMAGLGLLCDGHAARADTAKQIDAGVDAALQRFYSKV